MVGWARPFVPTGQGAPQNIDTVKKWTFKWFGMTAGNKNGGHKKTCPPYLTMDAIKYGVPRLIGRARKQNDKKTVLYYRNNKVKQRSYKNDERG